MTSSLGKKLVVYSLLLSFCPFLVRLGLWSNSTPGPVFFFVFFFLTQGAVVLLPLRVILKIVVDVRIMLLLVGMGLGYSLLLLWRMEHLLLLYMIQAIQWTWLEMELGMTRILRGWSIRMHYGYSIIHHQLKSSLKNDTWTLGFSFFVLACLVCVPCTSFTIFWLSLGMISILI